jgi:hypothetical protein
MWHNVCAQATELIRAPKRRRPQVRTIGPPPRGIDLSEVAERARYTGSPEHKDAPSFAGQPRPRADASICDRDLTQHEAETWLREAILRGAISTKWDGDFPRYVWFKAGAVAYEGRLINSGTGEYKGWPLAETEWPSALLTIYE